MKTTIPQKTPETAFWARRIFSARMPAKTAGRKIATAFRRFAKQVIGVARQKLCKHEFDLADLRKTVSSAAP